MTEPKTKLYFVKKPTQSSAEFGRKPVQIGTMKPVKTKRIRKIKEPFGDVEVIEPKKVKATSEQKLEALVKRERKRRAEHMYKPVELTPFAEEARQKIRAKTIVGQQQAKIAQEQALKELTLRQAENTAQRQALMAIPRLLQGQTQTLMALESPLQQNLMALQRVAPDVAKHMFELARQQQLTGEMEEPEETGASSARSRVEPIIPEDVQRDIERARLEPTVVEPTEATAQRSRQVMEDRELIRKLVQEEKLTREADIKRRFLEESPKKRMPNGYKDMIAEAQGEGKGLSFATTTVGKGRKGISGGGLLDGLENSFKAGLGNFANKMRTNIKNNPQGALLMGKALYDKFMKGGDLESANKLDNHLKQQFEQIHGAGFFDSLKNLAKKAVSKVVDVVKDDPIGTAKKAIELGKKVKGLDIKNNPIGAFKSLTGIGGALPLKHRKVFMNHVKKEFERVHGAGFFDKLKEGLGIFASGISAPFRLASKINPVFGFGVAQTADKLGVPKLSEL